MPEKQLKEYTKYIHVHHFTYLGIVILFSPKADVQLKKKIFTTLATLLSLMSQNEQAAEFCKNLPAGPPCLLIAAEPLVLWG